MHEPGPNQEVKHDDKHHYLLNALVSDALRLRPEDVERSNQESENRDQRQRVGRKRPSHSESHCRVKDQAGKSDWEERMGARVHSELPHRYVSEETDSLRQHEAQNQRDKKTERQKRRGDRVAGPLDKESVASRDGNCDE